VVGRKRDEKREEKLTSREKRSRKREKKVSERGNGEK
jgi:hypothetical protein